MFVFLKIVHFLAIALGGGASLAALIAPRAIAKSGHKGPPPPALAMTLRMLGIAGLIAIVLLWLTGLGLLRIGYEGADLGPYFMVKLAAATIIFGISVWMNLMAARAARTKTPVNPVLVRRLGIAVRFLLIITIIMAVLVFSRL